MSYVTMPFYVNPLLKRWLRPPPEASKLRINLQGLGILLGLNAFWVAVFYLIT